MDDASTMTTFGAPMPSVASDRAAPVSEGSDVLLHAGASVGRYVVMAHVGAGGMGRVYAAYDPELDRKVALKLLRAERDDEDGRNRLLGEARALARLAHPHVVTVHDVGVVDEQVFVAMEYVSGRTLRKVLARARPGWRQVLELLLPVARGLAAVHAAGLVHRDLKPENVMLGDDGRIRVMDFGLARAPRRAETHEATTGRIAMAEGEAEAEALTRTGTRLGTPPYMAPEQWQGRPADARTDQFAFCVMMWEALFGERPFAGGTLTQLERAITSGMVKTPGRARQVPRWLRRVLERALAVEREQRYASMDALMDALARGRRGARLRWLAAGTVVGGALLAGLVSSRPPAPAAPTPCEGLEAELAGVWDSPRREAAREALLGTGLPHAPATWTVVEAGLDQWAEGWIELSRSACRATHVHGVQSEALLDRSRACLGRGREEVRGLLDVLERADAEVVARAAAAVEELRPLSACVDAAALLAEQPPPASEHAMRVAEIRAGLDRAGAVTELVALDAHERDVRAWLSEADAMSHDPLRIEVRRALIDVHRRRGRHEEQLAVILEALALAARTGDAEQATSLRHALVGALTVASRLDEALLIADLTADELARPGREHERAELLGERGRVLVARGELSEARTSLEQAIAELERSSGPHELALAEALGYSSYVALIDGRHDDALALAQRAVARVEGRVGPEHPELVRPLIALGDALASMSRWDDGIAAYERALALVVQAFGPAHIEAAHCHWSMGDTESRRERFEAAREHYEQALAITQEVKGPDHPDTAECMVRVAKSLYVGKRRDDAEALVRRAIEIHRRHSGPESYLTLRARMALALMHSEVDADAAIADLHDVVASYERTLGEGAELLEALELLGGILVYEGRGPEALAPLSRALTLCERGKAGPGCRATLEALLTDARSSIEQR